MNGLKGKMVMLLCGYFVWRMELDALSLNSSVVVIKGILSLPAKKINL